MLGVNHPGFELYISDLSSRNAQWISSACFLELYSLVYCTSQGIKMKLDIFVAAILVALGQVIADDFCQVPIIPTITVTVTSHYTPPSSIISYTFSLPTPSPPKTTKTPSSFTSYTLSSPTRSSSKTTKVHKTSDYSLGPKATRRSPSFCTLQHHVKPKY